MSNSLTRASSAGVAVLTNMSIGTIGPVVQWPLSGGEPASGSYHANILTETGSISVAPQLLEIRMAREDEPGAIDLLGPERAT